MGFIFLLFIFFKLNICIHGLAGFRADYSLTTIICILGLLSSNSFLKV